MGYSYKFILTFLRFHLSDFLLPQLPGFTVTGFMGFTLTLPRRKRHMSCTRNSHSLLEYLQKKKINTWIHNSPVSKHVLVNNRQISSFDQICFSTADHIQAVKIIEVGSVILCDFNNERIETFSNKSIRLMKSMWDRTSYWPAEQMALATIYSRCPKQGKA